MRFIWGEMSVECVIATVILLAQGGFRITYTLLNRRDTWKNAVTRGQKTGILYNTHSSQGERLSSLSPVNVSSVCQRPASQDFRSDDVIHFSGTPYHIR